MMTEILKVNYAMFWLFSHFRYHSDCVLIDPLIVLLSIFDYPSQGCVVKYVCNPPVPQIPSILTEVAASHLCFTLIHSRTI